MGSWQTGFQAFYAGQRLKACPHVTGTEAARLWRSGWRAAAREWRDDEERDR